MIERDISGKICPHCTPPPAPTKSGAHITQKCAWLLQMSHQDLAISPTRCLRMSLVYSANDPMESDMQVKSFTIMALH